MRAVMNATLLFFVLIFWTASVDAAESYFTDIERILKNDKLVVAILAADAPPMIMTNEEGEPIGFDVDLARDVGKKLGVPVEFVRTADTYDGVALMVAHGKADVAVSFLSRSVDRAKKVFFTDPYVTQTSRVFYNRVAWTKLRERYRWLERIDQIAKTAAHAAVEIGVLRGSVYAAGLEREVPNIRAKEYESIAGIMAAVKTGEIFGGFHGEIQIAYHMRQHPEYAIYIGVEPSPRGHSDISIAVRPDAPNLLRWLNIYLGEHVHVLDAQGVIKRYEEQQEKEKREAKENEKTAD
jgi:polar amino acid transport system substrate-binding protein